MKYSTIARIAESTLAIVKDKPALIDGLKDVSPKDSKKTHIAILATCSKSSVMQ